jgi:hypothetical protein
VTNRYILDKTRHKYGQHDDNIIGSAQANPSNLLSNRLQQFSIQLTVAILNPSLDAPPAQMSDVHSVQSTNPKASQQAKGIKKK